MLRPRLQLLTPRLRLLVSSGASACDKRPCPGPAAAAPVPGPSQRETGNIRRPRRAATLAQRFGTDDLERAQLRSLGVPDSPQSPESNNPVNADDDDEDDIEYFPSSSEQQQEEKDSNENAPQPDFGAVYVVCCATSHLCAYQADGRRPTGQRA
jgi:hypothetical protein